MIEQEPSPEGTDPKTSGSELSETFESRPIGEYLRRQRILRGMSTEELASITRIPLRSLERLESGQFDGETDGFVRGFVRTVANALGLDAEDAISRMLQEPSPSAWERGSSGRGVKQGLVGLALLLMLVATFFVFRAGWDVLLGEASTPGSSEVVFWYDPVRALAEATGVQLDPAGGINPSIRPSGEAGIGPSGRPGSAAKRQ
jgi:transcriptional regulator with XRE-family HTH domain